MKITLISPRIALQKWDFLGSGIPYWPIEMAIFASALRQRGETVSVVDLFGSAVSTLTDVGDYLMQGRDVAHLLETSEFADADAFVIYAMSFFSFRELLYITETLRKKFPHKVIAVLENSQAVTGFALDAEAPAFFNAGASFLICGEPHHNLNELCSRLAGHQVIASNILNDVDRSGLQRLYDKEFVFPVPAWDLFPLHGYWRLPYAHGPKQPRFFPIITMRGCPYPCDFCVIPDTNDRRWRPRQPAHVVDEIIHLRDKFGVRDFHIEDVNPTVHFKYWQQIAELLIARNADIRFYFVSGTKAETVPIAHVKLLAEAGCRYISISPESGDPAVMKSIGKKFDYQHGIDLVAECHAHGIRTQACFLSGHPAEDRNSTKKSATYLRKLMRVGLDEAAFFIVAPLPGSGIHSKKEIELAKDGMISFSPKVRNDYSNVSGRRKYLIKTYFHEKFRQGFSLWAQIARAVVQRPATKLENIPWRLLYLIFCYGRNRIAR